MKNAYDYLVKNDIISKNMKGEISIKCYALDGREIYNGLNDNAIKKLKGFIDREELKEKINKQIKEIENIRDYPYSYKFLDTNQKKNLELECKYKIEAIKEILELLK